MLLFSCALVLFWIRKDAVSRDRPYWAALCLVFLYLSIDEAISIHELLSAPVRRSLDLAPGFPYLWVVPLLLAAAVGVIVFLPFFVRLPRPIRGGLIVAFAVYLTGSVGFELIEGVFGNRDNLALTSALVAFEECLELLGIILFLRTLRDYQTVHLVTPEQGSRPLTAAP